MLFTRAARGARNLRCVSLEDGIIYFERYVPFSAIGRFGGASTVKAFVASALEWRRRIDNMDEDDDVQPDDPQFPILNLF